jgi:hypothetical protein
MIHSRRWTVEIVIDEHQEERRTHAQARLSTQDRTVLRGDGTARRHPRDAEVPEIGDELSVARALSDLAHQLLEAAAVDIGQITRRPVRPRGLPAGRAGLVFNRPPMPRRSFASTG